MSERDILTRPDKLVVMERQSPLVRHPRDIFPGDRLEDALETFIVHRVVRGGTRGPTRLLLNAYLLVIETTREQFDLPQPVLLLKAPSSRRESCFVLEPRSAVLLGERFDESETTRVLVEYTVASQRFRKDWVQG